jgi:hypothetical protein
MDSSKKFLQGRQPGNPRVSPWKEGGSGDISLLETEKQNFKSELGTTVCYCQLDN